MSRGEGAVIDLSSFFGLPDWYQALTLSERAPAFRGSGAAAGDDPRAERRLARWQAQTQPLSAAPLPVEHRNAGGP